MRRVRDNLGRYKYEIQNSLFFVSRYIKSNHNSILKNVNVINQYPYYDKLYYSVVKKEIR